MDSSWTDEEILMELAEVFEEALSGKSDVHTCVKCGHKSLKSEVDEGVVRLECERCGFTFTGHLG